MPGSVAAFNLVNEPSVQDLVHFFGTFGQIDEVEIVPKKENNSLLKKLADRSTTVPAPDTSSSSSLSSSFELPSFTSPSPKGQLPHGFESKTFGAVIHFVEEKDAVEASRNSNGISWNGFSDQMFVFVLKKDPRTA